MLYIYRNTYLSDVSQSKIITDKTRHLSNIIHISMSKPIRIHSCNENEQSLPIRTASESLPIILSECNMPYIMYNSMHMYQRNQENRCYEKLNVLTFRRTRSWCGATKPSCFLSMFCFLIECFLSIQSVKILVCAKSVSLHYIFYNTL